MTHHQKLENLREARQWILLCLGAWAITPEKTKKSIAGNLKKTIHWAKNLFASKES